MSLFGTLNTSISGMAAQASKLGTIGDNIANSSTTGYKRASTEFETLLGNAATSDYQSGGVVTQIRYGVTAQGTITGTTSSTDLAIEGNGFFVVQDSSGGQALTRAGSFVPDVNGNLVNTAGYRLMGYNLSSGASTSGSAGLQVVNIASAGLAASPSTTAALSVNVPSTATTVAAADLPSANASTSTYTSKTSLTAYDNLGTPVTLDIYMTKSGVDASGNPQWNVAVFNKADAGCQRRLSVWRQRLGPLGTADIDVRPDDGQHPERQHEFRFRGRAQRQHRGDQSRVVDPACGGIHRQCQHDRWIIPLPRSKR